MAIKPITYITFHFLYVFPINPLPVNFFIDISISGKIYRLKSPNRRYLASVSSYDSSNPTKDWGFTDLYASMQHPLSDIPDPNCQSLFANEVISDTSSSNLYKVPNKLKKTLIFYVYGFCLMIHANCTNRCIFIFLRLMIYPPKWGSLCRIFLVYNFI